MGRIQGMAGHERRVPWHTPLQRPGCWPTPDALEVGCTRQGPLGMNLTESRSHMGLWAVTSAPLILGLDLRDARAVDFAWPLITNTEVLAVHAAWPAGPLPQAGGALPGGMVATDGLFIDGTIKPENSGLARVELALSQSAPPRTAHADRKIDSSPLAGSDVAGLVQECVFDVRRRAPRQRWRGDAGRRRAPRRDRALPARRPVT